MITKTMDHGAGLAASLIFPIRGSGYRVNLTIETVKHLLFQVDERMAGMILIGKILGAA